MTDTAELLDSMAAIPAQDWDALACPETATGRPIDPFTTHRFLAALEASGSTGEGTGWQARPLVLRDQGKTVAAMPLYVKAHSQGEYIFDHGWAEAYERAGGRYYPKLQVAVPFTPATGRRFLGDEAHRATLMQAAIAVAKASTPAVHPDDHFQNDHGIDLGSRVGIAAESFGLEVTEGELVAATRTQLTLRRVDERAGTVHVHFPRAGYVMRAVA